MNAESRVSEGKRAALKVLTQSDCLLNNEQVEVIANAMALLSEYTQGYTLFNEHLENASIRDCVSVLQEHYQSKRTDNDRRNKGRYYTPLNLVRFMNKTTLDVTLPRKLQEVAILPVEQQLSALLRFSCADISCGSGVFLTTAAKRIGLEVARVAFQSQQLTPDRVELGILLASEHCIYGVDLDPLAVELCKLSLWLNGTQQHLLTHLPLPPLSNIRCGDSLLGVDDLSVLRHGIPDNFYKTLNGDDKAIAAELRKRNKQERSRFRVSAKSGSIETLRTACNIWTSIYFIPKVAGALVPTSYTLQCVLNNEIPPAQQAIVEHVNEVAARLRFFHWRLEFPQVFLPGAALVEPSPPSTAETSNPTEYVQPNLFVT